MNSRRHGAELAACVRRAQSGDARAMDDLLREFRPQIYRYCLARLGRLEVAEDVTQETCIALTSALPTYKEQGNSFASFVFGIAANKIKMSHRSHSRRPEDVYDELPDGISEAPGPAEQAERNDELQQLLQHLDALPERHREILLMRVVAGLSAQEVAYALGMKAGAVRVAQHRAMNELRQQIGNTATGQDHA